MKADEVRPDATNLDVVRPLPGAGLVVRAGDMLMVCADQGDGADELLALFSSSAAGGADGSALVRRIAALLAVDETGRYPACAISGPAADGRMAVLVYGDATVGMMGPDGPLVLSGADAITSLDRLVPGPVTQVRLELPGAGTPDPRVRLESGVVFGAGVVVESAGAVADRLARPPVARRWARPPVARRWARPRAPRRRSTWNFRRGSRPDRGRSTSRFRRSSKGSARPWRLSVRHPERRRASAPPRRPRRRWGPLPRNRRIRALGLRAMTSRRPAGSRSPSPRRQRRHRRRYPSPSRWNRHRCLGP